jgi:hypothetical protein
MAVAECLLGLISAKFFFSAACWILRREADVGPIQWHSSGGVMPLHTRIDIEARHLDFGAVARGDAT